MEILSQALNDDFAGAVKAVPFYGRHEFDVGNLITHESFFPHVTGNSHKVETVIIRRIGQPEKGSSALRVYTSPVAWIDGNQAGVVETLDVFEETAYGWVLLVGEEGDETQIWPHQNLTFGPPVKRSHIQGGRFVEKDGIRTDEAAESVEVPYYARYPRYLYLSEIPAATK